MASFNDEVRHFVFFLEDLPLRRLVQHREIEVRVEKRFVLSITGCTGYLCLSSWIC